MKRIDLHCHSVFSDGSSTPSELVFHAKERELSAIALTDHDTLDGIPEAQAAGEKYGVEIVPGVEISTEGISQVHILGYYIDLDCKELLEAFRIQREEWREHHKIYMKMLNKYGFDISEEEVNEIAPYGGVGRAHYAKIMMRKGYVSSVAEAFDKYLGVGCPCYLKRNVMAPQKAITLIHKAGGLAFFAHPHQTGLTEDGIFDYMKQLKEAGLDGVEGYHSEYTEEMGKTFRKMADDLGLLLSGGSDYHGDIKPHIELGSGINNNLTVTYDVLEKIRQAIALR